MQIFTDGASCRVVLANGSELEVRPYSGEYDGRTGGLADGASHVFEDGCVVIRQGEQEMWTTPAKRR